MKILILFLLFVCVALLLIYGFKKEIISFICRLIRKKTGFSANILAIELSVKGIKFKQIILKKASSRLEIDSLGLGLSIRKLCLYLHIDHFNLYNSADEPLTNVDHTSAHKTNRVPVKNLLEKLTNLFERNYPKICNYILIKIDSLRYFHRDCANAIMFAENLIFEKQKMAFELNNFCGLQSKYLIRLGLKRHRILYTATSLFTNYSDRLHTTCLKGKVVFGASQQLMINVHTLAMILNHKKVADQPLTFENLKISLIVDQFDDRLELNPNSSVQLNDIDLEMKGRYNYEEDLCSILFYLTAQVENLIGLIPNLKVSSLKNFKSEGQICMGISHGFLWSDPLHYKFDVDYDVEELKIINPGIDLSYLQNSFSFKNIINKESHRMLNVEDTDSIENEHLLARIIQMSEDPNFYRHNGVDSYFVGVAIAYNLARKQFFKGASTLSMQLIKNLFLGEEKSLARKLEELILTLLMENYFKIPKERILSVYLQIIELGPDVYGITEAARFYYNKAVTALNLLDCLVLSYIIPRPRFFLDAFIAKSEQLDYNLSKHIENKLKMLITNQMITKDELLTMDKKVLFYNLGEFDLTKLDFSNLEHLITRTYQSLK